MKPIHVHWVIGLYDKVRNSEKMIENGFKAAAITKALDPEKDFGEEDPFSHLYSFYVYVFMYYVYVTNVSELFKCLFFLLQHLIQTSEIHPKMGAKNL